VNRPLAQFLIAACLGCASACLASCATTAAKPAAAGDRLAVDRLYPLREGSVWTYDVDTGEGLPILAITRVTRRDGERVEVTSGSAPIYYEQRADGLYRVDRQAYVLKAPLAPGAHWEAGGGSTAKVTAIRAIETAAGTFQDCVEVRETGGSAGKLVRTVYCPDVGPVEVESSMSMGLSGQTVRVLAKLRGYDFAPAIAE
jgi:hypothetical protein